MRLGWHWKLVWLGLGISSCSICILGTDASTAEFPCRLRSSAFLLLLTLYWCVFLDGLRYTGAPTGPQNPDLATVVCSVWHRGGQRLPRRWQWPSRRLAVGLAKPLVRIAGMTDRFSEDISALRVAADHCLRKLRLLGTDTSVAVLHPSGVLGSVFCSLCLSQGVPEDALNGFASHKQLASKALGCLHAPRMGYGKLTSAEANAHQAAFSAGPCLRTTFQTRVTTTSARIRATGR